MIYKHLIKVEEIASIIKCFLLSTFKNAYLIRTKTRHNINGNLVPYNFGDDINIELVKQITNHCVCYLPSNRLSYIFKKSYLVIGSTISFYSLKNVVIWGSGIRTKRDASKIKNKPLEVRAVRGPLTRKELLNKGIFCPEVYGDPALLLPYIYKPKKTSKYKIGIVKSIRDNNNKFQYINEKEIIIIDSAKYGSWKDYIDALNSCDYIASFTLHGIITSEAYKVPNVWLQYEKADCNSWFKYFDFYESIGKKDESPLLVREDIDINEVIDKAKKWKPGNIDLLPLVKSCPFEIKNELIKSIERNKL